MRPQCERPGGLIDKARLAEKLRVDNAGQRVLVSGMYHVGRHGKQTGPFSIDELKAMAERGELDPVDLVWTDGMNGWEPASTLPGIFADAPSTSTPTVLPPDTPPLVSADVLPPTGPGFAMGPRPNGMALTGMILGITSVTLGLCCCYGFPFNVAGIICSVIGMNQIKENPGKETGQNLAAIGLWCSIASIVIGTLFFIFGMALQWGNIFPK